MHAVLMSIFMKRVVKATIVTFLTLLGCQESYQRPQLTSSSLRLDPGERVAREELSDAGGSAEEECEEADCKSVADEELPLQHAGMSAHLMTTSPLLEPSLL